MTPSRSFIVLILTLASACTSTPPTQPQHPTPKPASDTPSALPRVTREFSRLETEHATVLAEPGVDNTAREMGNI